MKKPKEVWVFDYYSPKIVGPYKITGESRTMGCWYYRCSIVACAIISKDKALLTRKQAVEACYKHHEKRIKQAQKELNERKRLLKRFYSEEYYG